VVSGELTFRHRVLYRFALPDQIEHHHRVSEQHHHRGEEAKGDVKADVAAAESDDRGDDQSGEPETNGGNKRLSQPTQYTDPPSSFVVEWISALAARVPQNRRALDVATGRGRHAIPMAKAGFRVFGVDIRAEAVRDAIARAAAQGLLLRGWSADLTQHPLPSHRFELIVVTRYLQRDLFPVLKDALVPRGAIVYETFTEAQRALGHGPTSPDHLLRPGELKGYFEDFDVIYDAEVASPDALARLVAVKP
jgi:SAM-dependent methyltransferase